MNIPRTRLWSDVQQSLKCPICMERMTPPVLMCTRGHSLCWNCQSLSSPKCPVCLTSMWSRIRNRDVENILNMFTMPCPHSTYGCRARLCTEDYDIHVESCLYSMDPYEPETDNTTEMTPDMDDVEMTTRMLELLTCPRCATYMGSIGTCRNGHSMCRQCKLPSQTCPVCSVSLCSAIRNRMLEAIADLFTSCCVNKRRGCKVRLLAEHVDSHENCCQYNRYVCPLVDCDRNTCQWEGTQEELLRHAKERHTALAYYVRIAKVSFTYQLDQTSYHHVAVYYMKGKVFASHCCWNATRRKFFRFVRYIGPTMQAGGFEYEIVLVSQNSSMKRTFSRTVHSLTEDMNDIMDFEECFTISELEAQHYQDGYKTCAIYTKYIG